MDFQKTVGALVLGLIAMVVGAPGDKKEQVSDANPRYVSAPAPAKVELQSPGVDLSDREDKINDHEKRIAALEENQKKCQCINPPVSKAPDYGPGPGFNKQAGNGSNGGGSTGNYGGSSGNLGKNPNVIEGMIYRCHVADGTYDGHYEYKVGRNGQMVNIDPPTPPMQAPPAPSPYGSYGSTCWQLPNGQVVCNKQQQYGPFGRPLR